MTAQPDIRLDGEFNVLRKVRLDIFSSIRYVNTMNYLQDARAVRHMAKSPEATEDACSFVKIINRSDYKTNEELRNIIRHFLSRGLVCVLRGREVAGVTFDMESLQEAFCLDPHMRVDVQGDLY